MLNKEIKDFDDLDVFNYAKDMSNFIYDLTACFPQEEKYSLISQMRRASISIFGNMAEAQGRYHYKEKIHFYRIARGSLTELKSYIIFSMDRGYIVGNEYNVFIKKYEELQIKINNTISSLTERLIESKK